MKQLAQILALIIWLLLGLLPLHIVAQSPQAPQARERLLMDFGWRFAFGHATDSTKDFDPVPEGTGR